MIRRTFMFVSVAAMTLANMPLRAQETGLSDFRVESDIYFDMKQKPVNQSLTLFRGGICYDFASDLDFKVTVIDPISSRAVLLDAKRGVQAEVDLGRLKLDLDKLLADTPAAMSQITMREWQPDAAGDKLVLGNDEMHYVCTINPTPKPDMAKQYEVFASWSASLNALYPPKIPPYLRLALNTEVSSKSAIPARLERNVKGQTVYAITTATWQLSQSDLKRIESVHALKSTLRAVSIAEFHTETPRTADASR